jgi:hypothetical protein
VGHAGEGGVDGGLATLLGDAAHGVDPILAQGAGVALEDAETLARALANAGPGRGRSDSDGCNTKTIMLGPWTCNPTTADETDLPGDLHLQNSSNAT